MSWVFCPVCRRPRLTARLKDGKRVIRTHYSAPVSVPLHKRRETERCLGSGRFTTQAQQTLL